MLTSKECVNLIIAHLVQQGFVKPQTAQLSPSVAGTLLGELKNTDNRLMGDRNCARVSNPLPQPGSARATAKPSYSISSEKQSLLIQEEVYTPFKKGFCNQSTQSSTSREFQLNSLPSPQERGPDETSHQPQEIEWVGGTPALQNGEFGDTQGATKVELLDGEGEPQGYQLPSSNSCDLPTHATFSGRAGALSVNMPAFRPVLCTLGIH